MTNKEMADKIATDCQQVAVKPRFNNQIEVLGSSMHISGLLKQIKSLGFEHLSNITCVDWIEENRFDVIYNLWSYKYKLQLTLKADLNRRIPELPTALEVWPQAQGYEREIHEMFGVKFLGNPDLSPIFLHNWQDLPPLRKDFNTEEFANQMYAAHEEGRD